MSNDDCDPFRPSIIEAQTARPLGSSPGDCAAPNPAPLLNKLMALRDALVALKGPLSDEPGFRRVIESVLLNNEVHERVLGKRVREATAVPFGPRLPLQRRLEIYPQGLGESLDQRAARRVVAQDQIEGRVIADPLRHQRPQ